MLVIKSTMNKMLVGATKSVDPGQTVFKEQSNLGLLHCLSMHFSLIIKLVFQI